MAKIKKKGTSGATQNYYTRTQSLRKLQISLPDFRRLCIFKGIYPREPRSKKRVSSSSTPSTTFYYAKDIQYLLHEPLLAKFRQQKALSKKISKALGRGEVSDAKRWESDLMPRMRLDHIIKERYPTFVDALRDLDDALTLLFLFANLPSTPYVPAKVIARCQRLTLEFEHYIIRTASLRKSFLSIKGIYYQATIQGQDILWLVPYKFVQRGGAEGGGEVDYRIMATFVEFYASLLGFVNFRLYTGIGLVYPPRLDQGKEDMGAELGALKIEGKDDEVSMDAITNGEGDGDGRAQEEADRLLAASALDEQQDGNPNDAEEPVTTTTLDTFAPIDSTADTLLQPSLTSDPNTASKLFEHFTFFLSRETPRHPLEFILRAFGCKRIAWSSSLDEAGLSGSYCNEDDERITHQVVDRPDLPLPSPPQTEDEEDDGEVSAVRKTNERVPGRVYVQPQWIWDSINSGYLLRTDLYAPGATLPPHLSPFVKPKKGEYDPTKSVEEQDGVDIEDVDEDESDDDEDDGAVEDASEGEEVEGVRGDEEARQMEEELPVGSEEVEDGGMDVQLGGPDDGEEDESVTGNDVDDNDWDGLSGDEEQADLDVSVANDAVRRAQAELEAEALGRAPPAARSERDQKKAEKETTRKRKRQAELEAKEAWDRSLRMASNKNRKVLGKIHHGKSQNDRTMKQMIKKKLKSDKEKKKLKSK